MVLVLANSRSSYAMGHKYGMRSRYSRYASNGHETRARKPNWAEKRGICVILMAPRGVAGAPICSGLGKNGRASESMRGRACGEAGIVRPWNLRVLRIAGRCPVWEARLGACSRRARRDIRDQMGAWACLARGRARERVASRAGSLGMGEDCGRMGGQSMGGELAGEG